MVSSKTINTCEYVLGCVPGTIEGTIDYGGQKSKEGVICICI